MKIIATFGFFVLLVSIYACCVVSKRADKHSNCASICKADK